MNASSASQVLQDKFPCDYENCETSFGRLKDKERHIKNTHLRESARSCPACHFRINRPDGMVPHLRNQHVFDREPDIQMNSPGTVFNLPASQFIPTAPNMNLPCDGSTPPNRRSASEPCTCSNPAAYTTTLTKFPPVLSHEILTSHSEDVDTTISLQPQEARTPTMRETVAQSTEEEAVGSTSNLDSHAESTSPLELGNGGTETLADWMQSKFNEPDLSRWSY